MTDADIRDALRQVLADWQALTPAQRDAAAADPTRLAAVALGRRGGAVTSAAKARAARENGKRGGRPRKKAAQK